VNVKRIDPKYISIDLSFDDERNSSRALINRTTNNDRRRPKGNKESESYTHRERGKWGAKKDERQQQLAVHCSVARFSSHHNNRERTMSSLSLSLSLSLSGYFLFLS
jgi:hypothetical protein